MPNSRFLKTLLRPLSMQYAFYIPYRFGISSGHDMTSHVGFAAFNVVMNTLFFGRSRRHACPPCSSSLVRSPPRTLRRIVFRSSRSGRGADVLPRLPRPQKQRPSRDLPQEHTSSLHPQRVRDCG